MDVFDSASEDDSDAAAWDALLAEETPHPGSDNGGLATPLLQAGDDDPIILGSGTATVLERASTTLRPLKENAHQLLGALLEFAWERMCDVAARPTVWTNRALLVALAVVLFSNTVTLLWFLLLPLKWFVIFAGVLADMGHFGLWVEITLAICLCAYVGYARFLTWARHQTLIHSTSLKTCFRSKFRRTLLTTPGKHASNPHGGSAALRTIAEHFVDDLAVETLTTVYSVQDSIADRRNGIPGHRDVIWESDAALTPKTDPLPARPLFKFTDVDYYTNPIQYRADGLRLIGNEDPVVLYTFAPASFVGGGKDYEYVMDGGVVRMKLEGGGEYTHPLWDYTPDLVTEVVCPILSIGPFHVDMTQRVTASTAALLWVVALVDHTALFPLVVLAIWCWFHTPVVRQYYVEKRRMATDRYLVAFIPRWYSTRYAWFYSTTASLKRVTVERINGVQLRHYIREGTQRVVMRLDSIAGSVDVDLQFLNRCVLTCTTSPKTWCPSSVQRLRATDDTLLTGSEELLAAIVTRLPGTATAAPWYDPGRFGGVAHFTNVVSGCETAEEAPMMRAFMKPVWNGVAIPTRSKANEIGTIHLRVHAPRHQGGANNGQYRPLPAKYRGLAVEYARLLLGDQLGSLTPYSAAEVETAQSRPTQVASAARERPLLHTAPLRRGQKAFQKAEPSNKFAGARNITNVDVNNRIRYSTYTLAMADQLKRAHWYAFGRHPREIAELLHMKFRTARVLWDSDFSKFDGSLPPFARVVEQAIIMAAFPAEFHAEIAELQNDLVYTAAKTSHGVKYFIWSDRPSGGADTSIGNSITNSFTAYCSFRLAGLTEQGAWDALGLYAGDDGGTADLPVDEYRTVITDFGLEVKLRPHTRDDDPAFPFLGRVYPHVWTSSGSTIDIPRCVGKLHTTTCRDLGIPDAVLAWRKAASLFVTDSQTPFLGPWAEKVLTLVPGGRISNSDAAATNYTVRQTLAADGLLDVDVGSSDLIKKYAKAPLYPPAEDLGAYLNSLPGEFVQTLESWAVHCSKAKTLAELFAFEDSVLRVPPAVESVVYPADGVPYLVPGERVVSHAPEDPPPPDSVSRFSTERRELVAKVSSVPVPVKPARPALPCHLFNGKRGCTDPCPRGRPHVTICRSYARGNCTRSECKFAHVDCPYGSACRMGAKCSYRHATVVSQAPTVDCSDFVRTQPVDPPSNSYERLRLLEQLGVMGEGFDGDDAPLRVGPPDTPTRPAKDPPRPGKRPAKVAPKRKRSGSPGK